MRSIFFKKTVKLAVPSTVYFAKEWRLVKRYER